MQKSSKLKIAGAVVTLLIGIGTLADMYIIPAFNGYVQNKVDAQIEKYATKVVTQNEFEMLQKRLLQLERQFLNDRK
jgi:sulfite exporter TauE/SafE